MLEIAMIFLEFVPLAFGLLVTSIICNIVFRAFGGGF